MAITMRLQDNWRLARKRIRTAVGFAVVGLTLVSATRETSLAQQALPTPTGLRAVDAPDGSWPGTVVLEWSLPGFCAGGCSPQVFNGSRLHYALPLGSYHENRITVPFLRLGKTHTLTVRFVNRAGQASGFSNSVTAAIPPAIPADVTPPSRPANLRLGDDGGMGGAMVLFEPSVDDSTSLEAMRYLVSISAGRVVETLALDDNLREQAWVPFNGLTHTITVWAFDSANNASAPATLTVRPQ